MKALKQPFSPNQIQFIPLARNFSSVDDQPERDAKITALFNLLYVVPARFKGRNPDNQSPGFARGRGND